MPNPRYWLPVACLLVALSPALPTAADALKIGGFWIENVTIEQIDGQTFIYLTSTGNEVTQPLEKVAGVRLVEHPELGAAQKHIEADRPGEAVAPLLLVLRKARRPWVRIYAGYLLIGAADRAGKPAQAVKAYLTLIRLGADPAFLGEPPVRSVSAAPDATRQRIAAAVRSSRASSSPAAVAHLDDLLAAAESEAAADPRPETPTVRRPAAEARPPMGDTAPPAAGAADGSDAGLELPASVGRGPVVDLVRAGRYDEALAVSRRSLREPGVLSQKLYLHGMAQLGLAEKSKDPAAYRGAGLSFMRVVIYFPTSTVIGPALVEAGYVHERIDRPDIAARLYEQASGALDADDDPEYTRRLVRRRSALDR